MLAGGELAIIAADADVLAAWGTAMDGPARDAFAALCDRATARVWVLDDRTWSDGARFPLRGSFTTVDKFHDGRWLVIGTGSVEQGNLRILDSSGAEIRRLFLGHGIAHAKVDSRNWIWVGWSDEGVFGNESWRVPGCASRPSRYGVAAFSDAGVPLAHADLESIADCYALNLSADAAWACTYTDFPICRMDSEGQCVWQTQLGGTSAIAVSCPYVLAAAGYAEDNGIQLLHLGEDNASCVGEWHLPFQLRRSDRSDFIDGRSDELHVVKGELWHRWRVEDFVKAAGVRP